jgi:hypothetical protein
MAEIKDYSVTADDNNDTSPAGMPENMAPSGVNNSWRESFARVKRWYEDINGTKSTTGSSNAYVLAAARTVTAYAQGDAYMFRANFTNTAAVTLNVDSVGAVAIVNNTQSALAAGQIQSGGMYLVAYDATNSKFQLVGASATSASGDNIFIFNASPSATLENSTAEDSDGGRESTIQWKGLQSGSEESTLVKIIGSHDGSSDDQKGKLQIYTNDGADGDSPTLQLTIDSAGLCALVGAATIGGTLTVTGVTTHGGNVVSDTDSTDDLGTTGVRWANLFVDGITATDQITATGFTGTLDGILGSGAAAAATVTTLDTSGVVNLNLTTDSSSSTSGALIIDGGVGIAKKLFVGTDADIDGTLEADAITLNGTALGSLYSPIAGSASIVTTGALNSGSITSGFGAIDNGASAITTTGVITGGTVEATTDTSAGDAAAIGYTAAEGLILTGQGSTSDVTIQNDAAATVISIPTGTTNVGIGSTSAENPLTIQDIGGSTFNRDFAIRNGDTSNYHRLVLGYNAASAASGVPTNAQFVLAEKGGGYGTNAGLVVGNSDNAPLMFTTNATERMRIDSSGNVGIGKTPTNKSLELYAASDTGLRIQNSTTGTGSGDGFLLEQGGADTLLVNYEAGVMKFLTSGAERMRIAADGKVGIGLTSPTTTLHVKSPTDTGADVYAGTIENAKTDNGTATTGLRVKYTSLSPSDGNHIFQCLDSGGTVRFFVQNNGTRGGTSDRTLKENIVDATDKLAELRQLQVRNYNWIDHSPMGGFKELGFIAQEVEAIFPKMVRENPETGKKMLLDDVFVPILVKSLQEAADKIDALEARITALEG